MKIGIDIRILSSEQKKFSGEFIKFFHANIGDNILQVYSNTEIDGIDTISSKRFNSFFGEQVLFLKRLLEDKNDIIITFNDTFPIFYKKKFIQIITSLEKLLYPTIENSQSFKKHSYQNILKANLKKAEKIICFDEKTKKDINEKLNIEESKIELLSPFFYKGDEPTSQIDIKLKYSLNGDYIIYDSETGTNKNIKRLLESISKTNINIIFIGNKISSDMETRELIIRLGLKDRVIFAGIPDNKELGLYYKQSLGVIFPLLYSSFPFSLSKAIQFKTQILGSNIDEMNTIFENNINYFLPTSTIEITECIENIIKTGKKEINYDAITQKYTLEKFSNNLSKICQI